MQRGKREKEEVDVLITLQEANSKSMKTSFTPWISQFQDLINCFSTCLNPLKFSIYYLELMEEKTLTNTIT